MLEVSQYQVIRDRLSQIDEKNGNVGLRQLKSHFRDEINSQRVFEGIHTLFHLLIVLEKRDVIGYAHVNNLQLIIEIVAPHDNIIQDIFDKGNIFNWNLSLEDNRLSRNERVLPAVPLDYIEKIHMLIKNDMGKKWKELARALAIGEGNIDALDDRYRGNIPEMVNEILRLHQENCGVNFERWRSKLQEALVTARRKDLSVKIDDILIFMPTLNSIY